MPVVLLERLPLPSLRTYSSISVLLLACAVYYSHHGVIELGKQINNQTETGNENMTDNGAGQGVQENQSTVKEPSNNTVDHVLDVVEFMFQEPWCIWVMVNMAYCCFILVGKLIQWTVFGQLRVSEQQHLKDKFWNFIFYKFIFVFGVVNAQSMEEVFMWGAWFSLLGFLHLLAQLSKDRFEYLSFSPTTPAWTHAKVLTLLLGIEVICGLLIGGAAIVGFHTGINTFAFMAAECLLLSIKTLYVVVRYGLHLWDMNLEGTWENRSVYVYYTELIFELSVLFVDFGHHIHMLVHLWGNIFLSMASLVICMQLRYLFHEIQRRIKRHKNYLKVVRRMESEFPVATAEDLNGNDDDCAICWDKMAAARKLPCGHLFHNACLRSWLEQDTSCPTCRTSLGDHHEAQPPQAPTAGGDAPPPPPEMQRPVNTTNHFFHFDGSRYVSWLPSFSVEVTHTTQFGNSPVRTPAQTSQLDNMARQVIDLFPNLPMNAVIEDLRVTRAVELTIDNILEGRVTAPPVNNNVHEISASDGEGTDSDSSDSQDSEVINQLDIPVASSRPVFDDSEHPMPSTSSYAPSYTPENREHLSTPTHVTQHTLEEPSNYSGSGSRFSKSSSEREAMLSSRKQTILESARRRFLSRNTEDSLVTEENAMESLLNESPDETARRRELAFQAAQRRLQQN